MGVCKFVYNPFVINFLVTCMICTIKCICLEKKSVVHICIDYLSSVEMVICG